MFSDILGWIIDAKTMLQSIDLASVLGSSWVGPNLTMWDIMTILFFTGTLTVIFSPESSDDDDLNWDTEDL